MLFSDISVLDASFHCKPHQYVATEGKKIVYIGDEKPEGDFGELYNGHNRLLMSGLCNAHSHAAMTLLRGYAENLPLDRWLNERVFPFEDKIQNEDAYYSTLLAIAEMLRTGTTSFTDMYFFSEHVIKAVGESGMFAACGVFDVPTTAAHCVWVTDSDMDILKEKGVTVATNPASNLKLGSGVCNIYALLKKGINAALGTDSVASNNNLDMFREMYLCALLPKGFYRRPDVVSERDVLKMATQNGYAAQGRTDCGTIEVGNRADLIVVDLDTVHMCPHNDTVNHLVYAASGADVLLTMADGKALYKDGVYTTIDIEKVKREVEARTERIQNEVNKNA